MEDFLESLFEDLGSAISEAVNFIIYMFPVVLAIEAAINGLELMWKLIATLPVPAPT